MRTVCSLSLAKSMLSRRQCRWVSRWRLRRNDAEPRLQARQRRFEFEIGAPWEQYPWGSILPQDERIMREICMQHSAASGIEDRQRGRNVFGAVALLLTLASATAAGLSAAVAASGQERFRSVRHEQSRSGPGFDDFSSARRAARPRVRIEVRRQFWIDEPGAIYGYAPGNYILGPYGMLYGPYPIRPSRSVVSFDY